jgi:hypothetical protein
LAKLLTETEKHLDLCHLSLPASPQLPFVSSTPGQFQMKTVAEYRQFARMCREMATKIVDPKDKHAVELMAEAWEKVAADREAVLQRGAEPIAGPGIVPPIAWYRQVTSASRPISGNRRPWSSLFCSLAIGLAHHDRMSFGRRDAEFLGGRFHGFVLIFSLDDTEIFFFGTEFYTPTIHVPLSAGSYPNPLAPGWARTLLNAGGADESWCRESANKLPAVIPNMAPITTAATTVIARALFISDCPANEPREGIESRPRSPYCNCRQCAAWKTHHYAGVIIFGPS